MDADSKPLSERERTVLLLAAEGLTDKQIAYSLNLSRRTIGTYWERMRLKYGPSPRAQLVAKFLRSDAPSSFGGLFSSWKDGVWVLSREGRTVYVNDRTATLLGVDGEELVGEVAASVLRQLAPGGFAELMSSARKGDYEREVALGTGRARRWVRVRATPSESGGKANLVLLLTDVTVHKRVEATLSSCDATLAFVSDFSSDLIARVDAERVVVAANPSLLKTFGRRAAEVVGRPLRELPEVFAPAEEWCDALEACLKTGKRQALDHRLPNGDSAETHLLPEPTMEDCPRIVMSLTRTGK